MALQTTHTHTVTRTVTASPAPPSPPPPPPPVPTDFRTLLAEQRMRDLLASVRDIPALNPLAGIVSGPGNQGSSNTAHMSGQAGTKGDFFGSPRSVKFGLSGSKPQ